MTTTLYTDYSLTPGRNRLTPTLPSVSSGFEAYLICIEIATNAEVSSQGIRDNAASLYNHTSNTYEGNLHPLTCKWLIIKIS